MSKVILYKVAATGAMMFWSVEQYSHTMIQISWGQLGGSVQNKLEQVKTNQSGRTMAEQVCLRMDSRVNNQLDKGYKRTKQEALDHKGTNASGFLRPMLAQTYDREKAKASKSGWWQYKYNGHRCLITRVRDSIMAYSRNGKPIDSIPHILNDIDIPEGVTLDGELYVHGPKLQTISSIIKRKQPDSALLQYIVYDQISPLPFAARFEQLYNYGFAQQMFIAPTERGYSPDMAHKSHLETVQKMGYEGLMFRDSSGGYAPGKRSSQLNKVKMWLDCEATILEVYASKDGWAIFDCVDDGGNGFRVSAPGTIEEKTKILENKEDYIGKRVNVEYFELTAGGVPFHAVATGIREEE
jgi:ATP-dependent DNA ligase